MTASEKYIDAIEKEFYAFCDYYLTNDSEVLKYCSEKHIPLIEKT